MRTNKITFIGVSAVAAALLASCGGSPEPKFNPENDQHLASYMLGRDMGRALKEMVDVGTEINDSILVMAMREVLKDTPAQISDSTLRAVDAQFKKDLRDRHNKKRKQLEDEALDASNKFLEENKKKEGVVTTESGLQYTVITEGTGAVPTSKDKVKVHYHGTLPDGTVFDSSVDRGEPASFAVEGVIKGWTEALQLMKTGSKYKVVVPPDLAYGKRGMRGPIGPNAVLIFDIELLDIEKPEPAAKK